MAVSGAALGAVGLLLAHGTAGPVGVLYRLALHLPGGAMMREPQKWVALVALATGIGLGLLVDRVATTAATRSAGGHPHLLRMVVGAVVVLQLVLGSGFVRGIVEPGVVHYPASWDEAASVLAREPGRAVAVPWRSYLRLGFVGDRVVGGAVRARFGDRVETGTASGVEGLTRDDERGAAVAAAIDEVIADESGEASLSLGAQLRVLGVAWVVEVRESSGDPAPALAHDPDLDLVVDGAELRLWRVVPLLTIDN